MRTKRKWAREVEDNTAAKGPELEVLRDEFRALIDADGPGKAVLTADALQHLASPHQVKRGSMAGENLVKAKGL